MSHEYEDPIDARFSDLAQRTHDVQARAGFSARVMARVAAEPRAGLGLVRLRAWHVLPFSALAALSVLWAVSASSAVNEELAASYDDVELEW
jgi:uncharacterized membrane protein